MNRLPLETPRLVSPDDEPVDAAGHEGAGAVNPLLFVHSLLRGRYWLAILLAVVAMPIGAVIGYRSQTPVFASTGLIRIKPNLPRILYQSDQNGIMPMFDSFVESQLALITGERVVRMAMEDREWAELGRGVSAEATLAFMSGLSVQHPRNSELLVLTFTDKDPAAAQKAVGAIIRAYQRRYGDEDPDSVARRIAVLDERKTVFSNELTALNNRIRDIGNEYGAPDLDEHHAFELSQQHVLESQWRQAELALALAENGQGTPTTKPADKPAASPAVHPPELLAMHSAELRSLISSKRELERGISVDRTRLGDQHRNVVQARSNLVAVEKQIEEEAARVRDFQAKGLLPVAGVDAAVTPGAGKSVATLQAEERNVRLLFEKAKAKAMEVGRKSVEMSSLKSEADGVKAKLDETKLRIDQLNLESNGSLEGRIKIESWGDRPLGPAKDKRLTAAAAGAVALSGLGVGVVLLLGFLDRRVRHVTDVHMGVSHANRILGLLPYLPDTDADPEQSIAAAHAVHLIRTMLQRRRAVGDKPVFAVTSPSPGAGKTSLALALGLSFAASGAKTLLIDCDIIGGGLTSKMKWVARRRLGQILIREGLVTLSQLNAALAAARRARCRLGEILVSHGVLSGVDLERALEIQSGEYVGLREALNGDPVKECITGTGTPGLFLLPLGSAQRHHAAQLSFPALRHLLDQVRPWFDVVLIDTGPVCGSLEASVVAMAADEVVLTVARGEQRPLMQRAVDQLVAAGANVAGIVLNRAGVEDMMASGFSSSTRSVPMGADGEVPSAFAPLQHSEHKYLRLGPIATAVAEQTDLTRTGRPHQAALEGAVR